jgi:4-hydroxy-4-methyl-2-oxoglutarate aldolase
MKKNIIDFIKRNRVSTTELADCMGKVGAIQNVKAINRSHFSVGNLKYIYACNGTNWDVHKQIEAVEDGDVVFVDILDTLDKAVFGDLVAKYLLLYKQSNAIVVNGLLRDAPKLIKENWPIWCDGFSPVGYINEDIKKNNSQLEKIENRRSMYDGSIMVCDDTGVVYISKEFHNQEFLEKIKLMEEQEDIWLDCIDRKKYSTFETVCLKKYLK